MTGRRWRTLGASTRRSVVIFSGLICSWACGDPRLDATWLERGPEARPPGELAALASPILGGLVAPSPELDHTGALVYRVRATGEVGPLCTASLIAPETLVTAKHCISVLPIFERIGIDVLWARGADFNAPADLIPLAAVAGAPSEEPGLSGYGRDVGVAHLDRPVLDITPLGIRRFTADLLGASMVTLGYGVSSANGSIDGRRRSGRETIARVEGNAYEALLGDFESFVELVVTQQVTAADILPRIAEDPTLADLEALRLEYAAGLLLPEHEAVTGKAPGDTQSCEVDSGGPLARVSAEGEWETYGVVSSGLRPLRPFCDFGQIFATLGPVSFEFLEAERGWTDPCGDVDGDGRCRDGVFERCETNFTGGLRRLVTDTTEPPAPPCAE